MPDQEWRLDQLRCDLNIVIHNLQALAARDKSFIDLLETAEDMRAQVVDRINGRTVRNGVLPHPTVGGAWQVWRDDKFIGAIVRDEHGYNTYDCNAVYHEYCDTLEAAERAILQRWEGAPP